jgi:hypothetical protein
MSISFNPWSSAAHFVDQNVLSRANALADTVRDKVGDAAGALATVRNDVRDGVVDTWNSVPGHDKAEQVVGDLTDKLPFNNVAKAGLRALAGQKEITLDQDAVEGIQNDPDFKKKDAQIDKLVVDAAQKDPRYGQSDFDIKLSDVPGIKDNSDLSSLALGGESGSGSKWHQLEHLLDKSDPEVRKTWGVAGNEQTWLLRHCQLGGEAHVSKDGTITIKYEVNDTLDLTPHHKMTLSNHDPYDVISAGMGAMWHGVLGASKPHITATFTRTVPGTGPQATGVADAGGTSTGLQPQGPGGVGTRAQDALGDLLQIGSETHAAVHADLNGGKFGFLGVPADLAKGARHLAGDAWHGLGL